MPSNFTSNYTGIIENLLITQNEDYIVTQDGKEIIASREHIKTHVIGNGSITYQSEDNNVIFTATPDQHNKFIKYIANEIEYADNPLTLELNEDIDIAAYFEYIGKQFNYSSDGHGVVASTIESGIVDEGTEITLTADPDTLYRFDGWYVGDQKVSESNPYTFNIISDTNLIGRFRDGKYFVSTSSNIKGINVWQSSESAYEGESITIRARETIGYKFSKWSNGETANPYTIVIEDYDISIEAIYNKEADDNTIYDWYAYVKDQTALNTPPKALLRVTSFKVSNDLLTTANSTINILEANQDINIGDILCLYNPKGIIRYYGIIKSINDKAIQCSQMQTFYKGKWIQENDNTKTDLESEFASILERYANGYMKNSTYQDILQYQEKAPLKISVGSQTSGNLTSPEEENTVVDMETYIYQLYNDYQIMLEFNIPYGSWEIDQDDGGICKVFKPNYSPIKIGNNTNVIFEISPTLKTEETNKLIIYDSEGNYRSTYITTINGIVKEPSSVIGRYEDIDTSIVFSDDAEEDLVKANLKEEMYNHKISFHLLIDNKLYKYDDFKLGMPVDIFNGEDYYASVITGIEISKNENQNVMEATFTCGFARTSLTKKLSKRLGVI